MGSLGDSWEVPVQQDACCSLQTPHACSPPRPPCLRVTAWATAGPVPPAALKSCGPRSLCPLTESSPTRPEQGPPSPPRLGPRVYGSSAIKPRATPSTVPPGDCRDTARSPQASRKQHLNPAARSGPGSCVGASPCTQVLGNGASPRQCPL